MMRKSVPEATGSFRVPLPMAGTKVKKSFFKRFAENFELLLLTLPALLCFLIFHYLPMFGVIIAFKDFNYEKGIFGSDWNGLKNFEFFFTSQDAWRITRNTIGYSIAFMVTGTIAAIFVALLLFEIRNKLALKVYQTVIILPRFLSWVVIGFITYIMLNPVSGIFNQILKIFGAEGIQWYSKPEYWPILLIVVNIWNGVGMGSIVYYASLMGIDSSLYEAAEIDGAGRWKQIWNISIPSLIPLIVVLNILAVGNIFRGDFGMFYNIPRDVGMLYSTTDIIDTYVFRGLRTGDIGMSSAVGFFQSFVGLVLVYATNITVKKFSPENALF